MKKLLIVAFMLVGFAGISIAQTSPDSTTTKHKKTKVTVTHKHMGKHKADQTKKTTVEVNK